MQDEGRLEQGRGPFGEGSRKALGGGDTGQRPEPPEAWAKAGILKIQRLPSRPAFLLFQMLVTGGEMALLLTFPRFCQFLKDKILNNRWKVLLHSKGGARRHR